ncbi:striatin-interacting protein 1 homolog [Prorops nasuta]|uniref:striatin-interacting protein 1 homolog n=1 Tax=Prorops nasuta TaxID=863751 RepID=UPI0034CFB9BA
MEEEDVHKEMDTNGNDKFYPEIIRNNELMRRRREQDARGDQRNDLDFVYDDADTHANEIAELYSYTEQPEFQLNLEAFEDQLKMYKLIPWWQKLSEDEKQSVIEKLMDQLEVSDKQQRMKAARCILYLAQGCWAEVQSDKEQQEVTRMNVMLLYKAGVFAAFIELLNIEIEYSITACQAVKKLNASLSDSVDLRIILSVLYIITEVMREELKDLQNSSYKKLVESFKEELINPYGEELLIVKLLDMVTSFCSGSCPNFPIKKILLLLWKLILVSLGGIDILRELKKLYRAEVGLTTEQEDTIEVAKNMRASSPPISAADLIEMQNQKKITKNSRRSLIKQSSLDDPGLGMEYDGESGNNPSGYAPEAGDNSSQQNIREYRQDYRDNWMRDPPEPSEDLSKMVIVFDPSSFMHQYYDDQSFSKIQKPLVPEPIKAKSLPWTPKVRQKDVDAFLEVSRLKFVGYKLEGDRESLAGLPQPIHEGVNTLKRHMYTSLSEIQIQKEEDIARNPMSTPEPPLRQTPTEILYQAILPNLPQYMIALLKILLAAALTSKVKTDSININADVLPAEMPMTVVKSMTLSIDVNRHKEIIVKAVSAILLLLLKHFKLNHIYQFEFMSQHLVFANCIILVLKFFNQNIVAYIEAKNVIPVLDFPMCVIGDQPELTIESLEIGDNQSYSWRNVFSSINLLRILNKLTKWKHSRIMMLVVFKSAPILKRMLKVRNAMMQLYVLKLLKMQTKYLGRQWRKTNMKTISVIYAKVRHRLNDDWAYGNDLDARPWDFQAEECELRTCVDQFNNRRYSNLPKDEEMEPVDSSITSVLGANIDLTEEFKQHYKLWLQQEVFQRSINWDELLDSKTCEI